MPRLLQIVHGFPPAESAGTEVYSARLADGLGRRGWQVHTLSATRQVGHPQYDVIENDGLTRIVQNMPFVGIANGERDGVVEEQVARVVRQFQPDYVHIQHVMFLSAGVRFSVPTFWTLHDAWGWCAAGGTMLKPGGVRCGGPVPRECLACARERASEAVVAGPAVRVAGRVAPFISADRLHRLYQRVPTWLRAGVPKRSYLVHEKNIYDRQENMRQLAWHCRRLISPSQFLAERAMQAGFPEPVVVPHGVSVPAGYQKNPGEYFLFLGTLAPHKGPLLVREAHQEARVRLPLRVVGPAGSDMGYLARLELLGPVERPVRDVWPLLSKAQAVVLGSIWEENAPLVVLEAQAAGVPVIAPRLGGLPELVRGGWLYEPGEKSSLVACLEEAERTPRVPDRPPTFVEHLDSLVAVYMNER